ncbi:PREDICTED: peroxisome proliferator-activated receptor gamma coactivator-related protein 1 isoform X3 [Condylura cristata]|uniref:peroxisome proliferator-activated receptor gamma coactivator-related protein 1 isoform X3 n=1 Tax=Condylura cristata TaxID=143302 RepID=UPI0006438E02|nr:PREDICTED: peroxisome proliferator-activated receptor gamma coactivator-related protein 1 isoform X3 [Condylura cristata]
MAARRGRRDGVKPPPSGGPCPDPGGGVRGSGRGSRSQAQHGTVGAVSGGEQVLLHEEGDDSGFVSLSRLGPCLKEKDLETEGLILQDETLLETMQSYMDASLISLIEDFGSLGESMLSLEDQNEVSLLTALTEILDNADSENLSPFDSIPDSELLVSPREGTSLHKLLTLSRTPPERDLITPVDSLGPGTGSSRMNGVEMSLADPPWDFSSPSFLENSSPKLPSWRPPRSRPRWGKSPPPQQRSDGEEEEEVASFSGQMLAGELDSSVSSILDFPMHLACPEEEDKTAAQMAVQAAGDESISSLSELVRAMHPYCLPNLTNLTSLQDELQEEPDDLTLPEDCVVLEIVGQAATAGNDLEIPVVVRQIPPGPQPVLLDDSLATSPALQLLMPTLESETEAAVPREALGPGKDGLSLESEGKLNTACLLAPSEVMEPGLPKGPQNSPDNAVLNSQRARKGRRKKSKEQSANCAEGYVRRLRSSSRGQSKVALEVNSQASNLPQEEPQREVGPPRSRGKPRAWARAWAAALEEPGSENLENSTRQASPAKESPLDLYPNLADNIQVKSVSAHHSLGDSSRASVMPLDSAEADPIAVDPILDDSIAVDPLLVVDLASAKSKLVDPHPTDPVLVDSEAADAAAVHISDDLPSVDPIPATPTPVDSVPDDPAPVDPVLVKSRPTDPRRGAMSALKSESADLSKAEVKEVLGPLKVESGSSASIQESRPRPLSLSEYWRRRQQRQVEAEEKSSHPPTGKWPSLPETPKGLADIPCLVIPPAPAKKTAPQRSPETTPEPCSMPLGPSPASPSSEPPASKSVASTPSEQVPSQEMPLPARLPPPTVQSMSYPMSTALPFTPGGVGVTPMPPLTTNGQGVPSLPPPPLQPSSLPVSMGPVPPDPYTLYAPVPPWPCYSSVSPGYPCLPPPPAVPLVSGTPGTYAVPPTCNVPWVPPLAPVPPYSSSCTYGPLGWGPGPQQPPFWPTAPPPSLPVTSVGAISPPKSEPNGMAPSPSESIPPGLVAPPLSLESASQSVPQIEHPKVVVKPETTSPHLKHKVSSPLQSPQIKPSPCHSAENVTVEESESERLKPETQEIRPREKPQSPVAKAVSTPTPRQSTVPKLPAVHPARLRKLAFLPTPRPQGADDVVQAFISEIGIEASDLSSLLEQFEKSEAKKECPPPAPADNLAVGNSGSSCSSSGRSRRCSSSSSSSSTSSASSSSSSSSRSRSRSPSPCRRSDRRRRYSSYRSHDHYQRQRVLQKERAIEERRVVFIGKIPGRMTRSELKQRFSVFGEIEECTIHFRVQGDNYGFVTYRYAEEAFAAIESGHKLRQADEQPFDLCFGGRRQFCKRSYSDLDSNREDFDPAPVKSKFDSLDFDTLLKQAQKNLRR